MHFLQVGDSLSAGHLSKRDSRGRSRRCLSERVDCTHMISSYLFFTKNQSSATKLLNTMLIICQQSLQHHDHAFFFFFSYLSFSLFTWRTTSKAGFAELLLCVREETSPRRRFQGSLVGVVQLKSFDSDPV